MRLTGFLALVLLLGGCGPFRRAKMPPPPGPTPARIPDQVASIAPAPPPKNLPVPPAIGGGTTDANPAAPSAVGLPTAKPPRPARRETPPVKRAATRAPAVVAPSGQVEATAPELPPYRLGELRTADEKERLRRETDGLIGQCATALSAVEGRVLTAIQAEMVGRVRTFAQQARETMDKDPGEARNFAAKGRTFAEALLAELK